MGTFGKSEVSISFKGDTPEQFKTVEVLTKELEDFAKGNFEIYQFNDLEGAVEFTMTSGRLENLEFQVESLSNYLRTHQFPVVEFMACGYQESDSGSLQWDGDDFDEEE